MRSGLRAALVAAVALAGVVVVAPTASGAVEVTTAADLSAAFADPAVTQIDVAADVVLGCDDRFLRLAGPPVEVRGGGHTVTDGCDAASTILLGTPATLSDITVVTAPGAATWPILAPSAALTLLRAEVEVRSTGGTLRIGPGSAIVDSTVTSPTEGFAVDEPGPEVVVDGSTITARAAALVVDDVAVAVRDSRIETDLRSILVRPGARATLERSSVRSGNVPLFVQGAAVVRDSTIVADEALAVSPGATGPTVVADGGTVDLARATVLSEDPEALSTEALLRTVDGGAISVRASALRAPTHQQACQGAVASGGFVVASDDSCPGSPTDRVVPDAGLAAYDVAAGLALPQDLGPLVDAAPVDECDGATDQRGLSRPQGPGCDLGAVEQAQGPVPPGPTTSSTTTTLVGGGTPPGVAPPATPVSAAARFTG